MSLLQIEGLFKHFGGVAAVDNVSFEITQGEILGLIGPNGSGKTTVLNLLSGFLPPDSGRVRMGGTTSQAWRPTGWRNAVCCACSR
ncbi:MAG: transporter [Ramlibacter sp.]|nr:transporter [Ramlibacter sp.]